MNERASAQRVLGGWQVSTIYKLLVGPADVLPVGLLQRARAFRAACIPAITNADAVFAQDKGSFDPAKGPLFNKDAFEPVNAFNYYHGRGNRDRREHPRVRLPEPGLHAHEEHQDGGGTNLQFRFEMFNMWNWHTFYAGWRN